jgi:hypothetical protein
MRPRHTVPVFVFFIASTFLAAVTAQKKGEKGKETALDGRRVTIQGDALPLAQALESLSKQSGIPVVNRLIGESPALKLDLNGVGFWNALDVIADAAGGRIDPFGGPNGPALVPDLRKDRKLNQPVSYSGPFRVSLQRISGHIDFESGNRGCQATVQLAWEPSFKPLYLKDAPENLVIQDPVGKVIPFEPSSGTSVPVDHRPAASVPLSLPALPRSVANLGLVKGTYLLSGTPRLLTFSFDTVKDLEKAGKTRKTEAGVSVTVSDVTLGDRAWTVKVTTELPPGQVRFSSYQFWHLYNEISLVHKDGKRILRSGSGVAETAGSSPRAVVSYNFENAARLRANPADWRLVYRAPASIIEVPIPFEFRDVPLP